MQNYISLFLFLSIFFISPIQAGAVSGDSLVQKLSGRFLLQTEAHGECYYVDPLSQKRLYLGRPHDAFRLMRKMSLGVSEKDFKYFQKEMPRKLRGRLIMRAENLGQAYYVGSSNGNLYSLGRPDDAYNLMREISIGINNKDLELVQLHPNSPTPQPRPKQDITISNRHTSTVILSDKISPVENIDLVEDSEKIMSKLESLELDVFNAINDYRKKQGLAQLALDQDISASARAHSQAMADGHTAFGHSGSDERFRNLPGLLDIKGFAENVAYNYNTIDPAGRAVSGWLKSSGHLKNLSGSYDLTGVGVAQSPNGSYYFTQIFVR